MTTLQWHWEDGIGDWRRSRLGQLKDFLEGDYNYFLGEDYFHIDEQIWCQFKVEGK